MKNFKLAWRNLWRNRRRTFITAASVLFAVFFALLFRSIQLGSYDHMFKNAIESYSGYIQIQQKDWWDEKTVDNSMQYTDKLEKSLLEDKNVDVVIPRFESFALASAGAKTKGVMVMGIDPDKENHLSGVKDKKVKYRLSPEAVEAIKKDEKIPEKNRELAELFENHAYTSDNKLLTDLGFDPEKDINYLAILASHATFKNGDIHNGEAGVWLGDKLASYMNLVPGDTLVLFGQGYHGTTAEGLFEIKGIIKQPIPDIDSRIVYMPFDIAQELYNAPGMLSSLALHINNNSDDAVEETVVRLAKELPENLRVVDWHEMNEILISQMDADNKSGMIMIGILYLVIAFGVFGTVLMMTAERKREFGVLVAIGMKKQKLAGIITYEMLLIGFLGLLLGSIIGVIAISIGVRNPIVFKGEFAAMYEEYGMEAVMKFMPIGFYFISQSIIVAFMVLISLFYPLSRIMKLEVVNALRA